MNSENQRPKIGIMGRYNTPNFGDQLIRRIIESSITVGGCSPVTLWPYEDDHQGYRSRRMRDAARTPTEMQRARAVSAGVFGGGGYLNDGNGWTRLLRYARVAAAWSQCGIPYRMIGVGAGPLSSKLSRSLVRRVVEGADLVAVRDSESADLLLNDCRVQSSIEVTADWALTLDEVFDPTTRIRNDKVRRIGIHLQTDSQSYRSMVSRVVDLISCHSQPSPLAVTLLFDQPTRNIAEILELADELSIRTGLSIDAEAYHGPEQLLHLVRTLDAVLTNKLHMSIVAWSLGVAIYGYSSHEKTGRFYRQVGRGKFQADWGESFDHIVRLLAADTTIARIEDSNQSDHLRSSLVCASRRNRTLVAGVL